MTKAFQTDWAHIQAVRNELSEFLHGPQTPEATAKMAQSLRGLSTVYADAAQHANALMSSQGKNLRTTVAAIDGRLSQQLNPL